MPFLSPVKSTEGKIVYIAILYILLSIVPSATRLTVKIFCQFSISIYLSPASSVGCLFLRVCMRAR